MPKDKSKFSSDKKSYHPPLPPKDGLILRVYYRTLARDSMGQLRHVTSKDFNTGRSESQRKEFFDSQPDSLWLTQAEWKSLVPKNPKKGDRLAVSKGIALRIFRFNLDPKNFYSAGMSMAAKDVRGGEISLVVEEVSDETVRLRLEGSAKLGLDFSSVERLGSKKEKGFAFEADLLGYLSFDRQKQKFTAFDVVAIGDVAGILPNGDYYPWYRPGRQPLGIAFDLVQDESLATNRVPPRGLMLGAGYWNAEK